MCDNALWRWCSNMPHRFIDDESIGSLWSTASAHVADAARFGTVKLACSVRQKRQINLVASPGGRGDNVCASMLTQAVVTHRLMFSRANISSVFICRAMIERRRQTVGASCAVKNELKRFDRLVLFWRRQRRHRAGLRCASKEGKA